ncbi:RAN binding protein-like protein [Coprinopsis cinerea okayama7|uniref:RAN binding protein-like protein n=1 Tax=Coprinopsis cinerea (strain Okayama-7 / 130 / ATCC MYA-4618 / FGSC 9003) TaxID=240176 RepID=A8N4A6_COPC7|nr:RAN binding protein-like protein [Coprinopsis cinerea okayama7\|eukprot:XP_001829701.1 RAN binding protein-like protein [Coprinopsis cinerea okayama7\
MTLPTFRHGRRFLQVMQNELGKIVEQDGGADVQGFASEGERLMGWGWFRGQLCTDLEEIIQEQYHPQLFPALIGALEDPEPRVHSHAAAALINFCEGVERDTLLPYMDPIVERLLKLLNPGQGGGGGSGGGDGSGGMGRRYVQEQAITTLAMVADASEVTFAKNADGAEYKNLRIKAMECAGLIGAGSGVGLDFGLDAGVALRRSKTRSVVPPSSSSRPRRPSLWAFGSSMAMFDVGDGPLREEDIRDFHFFGEGRRADCYPLLFVLDYPPTSVSAFYGTFLSSSTPANVTDRLLTTISHRIPPRIPSRRSMVHPSSPTRLGPTESPHDPNDTQLTHYLIATWAKICQAMGQEFEPYLPVVMPSLLNAASAKADISVYDEDVENMEEREGWEVIEMDGQTLGIRTSSIEDKCQAFETLVIYCSTLAEKYAPYLSQTLEITLPALKFYFHDGVREACAINTLTSQMVSASFHQIIHCISTEHDSSFLGSLYKCFHDSLLVLGGPTSLPADYQNALIEATKRQLQSMADRRKMRSNRLMSGGGGGAGAGALSLEPYEREDMAMMEEVEDYALEEVGRVLSMFDQNHPLLVAVGSVRDLGVSWAVGGLDDSAIGGGYELEEVVYAEVGRRVGRGFCTTVE